MIFPRIFLLIAALAVGALGQAPAVEPAVDGPVYEVYLARADEDGAAGVEVKEFTTRDIPIFCVVTLASLEPAEVRMDLIAVDVKGVKGGTRVVSTTYTTKAGENRVNFSGSPAGSWVAGTYRADIFVGGKRSASIEFPIKAAAPAAAGNKFAPAKPRPRSRKN